MARSSGSSAPSFAAASLVPTPSARANSTTACTTATSWAWPWRDGRASLHQARRAVTAIPPEPLVAGLAADPVISRTAPSSHLRPPKPERLNCVPFVHLTGIFPRHRQAPSAIVQTRHLSTRSTLYQSTRLIHGSLPLPACGRLRGEGGTPAHRSAPPDRCTRACARAGREGEGEACDGSGRLAPDRARGLFNRGDAVRLPGDHVIVLPAGWNIDTPLRRAEWTVTTNSTVANSTFRRRRAIATAAPPLCRAVMRARRSTGHPDQIKRLGNKAADDREEDPGIPPHR